MSGALTVLSAVSSNSALRSIVSSTGILPSSLQTLLLGVQRKIGTIIPDVTIEESHSDRVNVTQHPIADGQHISDHVYRQPYQVTMRCGWTNANPIGAAASGFTSGGGLANLGSALESAGEGLWQSFTEQRVITVYNQLQKLQYDTTASGDTRPVNVFTLTTGKRTYPNMVIAELQVRTDNKSEYSLFVEAHFQEAMYVTTQSTTQPAQTDQGSPSQTSSSSANTNSNQTPNPVDPKDVPSYLKQIGTEISGSK